MRLAAALAAVGAVLTAADQASAAECKLTLVGELPVVMRGMRPLIPATVNGQQVFFLADSGAGMSLFSADAVERFGLKPSRMNGWRAAGVGGELKNISGVRLLDFTLGKFPGKDSLFIVGPSRSFDDEVVGLIGQDFLSKWDVEYDLANSVIRLFRPENCGKHPLAYWNKQFVDADLEPQIYTGGHLRGWVTVNGQSISATLDTGAPISILSLGAAARAGVTPQTPGAVSDGLVGGLGKATFESWIVPVKSFGLGGEMIQNTQLRIGDLHVNAPIEVKTGSRLATKVMPISEMLLGADYFMSHRIFVANSQSKLYFTYNGGGVFKRPSP